MGWFSSFTDDVLGFDPGGGGIYGAARDVLGDTIADDILGMDPSGKGMVSTYNTVGPIALAVMAGQAIDPSMFSAAGSAGAGASAEAAMVESLTNAGYWGTGSTAGALSGAGAGAAAGSGGFLGTGFGGSAGATAGQTLTGNLISGGINALLGGGSNASAGAAASASDPFASQRPQYQQQLQQLMSGQYLTTDPSYAFRFGEGVRAVDRQQAAMGNLMSGNRLTALTDYGQNMAATEYGNQFNRLAQLSGANIGSPASAGQILYNQGAAQQSAIGTFASQIGKAAQPAVSNWLSSLF